MTEPAVDPEITQLLLRVPIRDAEGARFLMYLFREEALEEPQLVEQARARLKDRLRDLLYSGSG